MRLYFKTRWLLFIYLFIFNTKQQEVWDVKALLPGHYRHPFSFPQQPSQEEMCLCSWNPSAKVYSSSFLLSSLILRTSWKYFTKSISLSKDFPSLSVAKNGHQSVWLCESTFPHSEHFHNFLALDLTLHCLRAFCYNCSRISWPQWLFDLCFIPAFIFISHSYCMLRWFKLCKYCHLMFQLFQVWHFVQNPGKPGW